MRRLRIKLMGLWFMTLLVLTGAACNLAPPSGVSLEDAGDNFLERLRWQDYQGASRYLAPDIRQDFLDQMSLLKDLKVVDTRLEAIEFTEGSNQALSRGEVEYYLLPSITIQTLSLEQEWEYQPGTRTEPGFWLITTPFPEIPGGGGNK